jgi:putative PIN family toxin of toxin-antitoxin system
MRVTPDTAILVRAHAKATGPAQKLVAALKERGGTLILSQFLLDEVVKTLRYPRLQARYGMTDEDIAKHLQYLRSFAEIVVPAEGPIIVSKDQDDDPVVYTVVAGQADVICTVDRHFYEPDVLAFCSRRGIRVMSDVELLRDLRSQ